MSGVTLVEVLVAAVVLAVTTIVMTQAMLVMNRNSAIARVRNLAKAQVMSRIQEVAAIKFDPTAAPPVVPPILTVSDVTSTVNLGDSTAGIGALPATMRWTVANVGAGPILAVKCRVDYTYLKRVQSYEALTFRSPD